MMIKYNFFAHGDSHMKYKIESEAEANGEKRYFDIYIYPVKGPGKVCQPHIHSYFELFYCRSGSIVYICNEERIHLDEDDIIIVYPSVVHYTIAPRDVDITKFTQHVIKFSAEFLLPQLQTPADIQYLLLPVNFGAPYTVIRVGNPEHDYIYRLIKETIAEKIEKPLEYELALRANISLLYLWMLRNHAQPGGAGDTGAKECPSYHAEIISRSVEYIKEHYNEPISMSDVAQFCNVNYTYFCRLFRQYTNRKFSDYLLDYRIKKARIFLLKSSSSILDVSMKCGFDSVSYFIRKFRESTGLTPKKFRERYTKSEA